MYYVYLWQVPQKNSTPKKTLLRKRHFKRHYTAKDTTQNFSLCVFLAIRELENDSSSDEEIEEKAMASTGNTENYLK